jgi:hypothetical protein
MSTFEQHIGHQQIVHAAANTSASAPVTAANLDTILSNPNFSLEAFAIVSSMENAGASNVTPDYIINMSKTGFDQQILNTAIGNMLNPNVSAYQGNLEIVLDTINGPQSPSDTNHVPVVTEAQAEFAIQIIGQHDLGFHLPLQF